MDWKARYDRDVQAGFDRAAVESAHERDAEPAAACPHTDRLGRLLQHVNAGLEEVANPGGIKAMLSEPGKWDWANAGALLAEVRLAVLRLARIRDKIEQDALRRSLRPDHGKEKESPQEAADRANFGALFILREELRDQAGSLRLDLSALGAASSASPRMAEEIRQAALDLAQLLQEAALALAPRAAGGRPRRQVELIDPA
jgi:hypothetical protein